MTYYKKKYKLKIKDYFRANKYGLSNISLPMYPKLKNHEIDVICNLIKHIVKK